MIITIDFDGTVVKHKYPELGENCPGAVESLKKLTDKGHQLILDTMRSGDLLQVAIDWFFENNIPLFAIQENPEQKSWTTSTKIYADLRIDDSTLGAILTADIENGQILDRPYIDWEKAYKFMQQVYRI